MIRSILIATGFLAYLFIGYQLAVFAARKIVELFEISSKGIEVAIAMVIAFFLSSIAFKAMSRLSSRVTEKRQENAVEFLEQEQLSLINETLSKIKTAYKQVVEKEDTPDFNKRRASVLMANALDLSELNVEDGTKEVLAEMLVILNELKTMS